MRWRAITPKPHLGQPCAMSRGPCLLNQTRFQAFSGSAGRGQPSTSVPTPRLEARTILLEARTVPSDLQQSTADLPVCALRPERRLVPLVIHHAGLGSWPGVRVVLTLIVEESFYLMKYEMQPFPAALWADDSILTPKTWGPQTNQRPSLRFPAC
jgi:hypothetical protein